MALLRQPSREEIERRYTSHGAHMGLPVYYALDVRGGIDLVEANGVPSWAMTVMTYVDVLLNTPCVAANPTFEPVFRVRHLGPIKETN